MIIMMNSWETMEEDIFVVLKRHGLCHDICDPIVREVHQAIDSEKVEMAVSQYILFDHQIETAYDEIENILINKGIIPHNKKQFEGVK
jgi:hypothetical protein